MNHQYSLSGANYNSLVKIAYKSVKSLLRFACANVQTNTQKFEKSMLWVLLRSESPLITVFLPYLLCTDSDRLWFYNMY